MNLHTAYLCLGSNSDAYERLEMARALLEAAFGSSSPCHSERSEESVNIHFMHTDSSHSLRMTRGETDNAPPLSPILFSSAVETEAVGEGWLSPFVNQVARLHTTLSAEEIRKICKEIERICGRTEGEKARGRMSMDVDLLTYDDAVLKPKDMQRDYILQGISELS